MKQYQPVMHVYFNTQLGHKVLQVKQHFCTS